MLTYFTVCGNNTRGNDCSKTCGQCLNDTECDAVTGECAEMDGNSRCATGYTGSDCMTREYILACT